MNLHARIARLERSAPRPGECGKCAAAQYWVVDDAVIQQPPRCDSCGRAVEGVKVYARSLWEAL